MLLFIDVALLAGMVQEVRDERSFAYNREGVNSVGIGKWKKQIR